MTAHNTILQEWKIINRKTHFQIFLWIMHTIYVNNFMLTMARVKSAPIRQLRQICVINAIYRLNIFLSAQHLGNHEFVYVNRDALYDL